jgi:protoheme IX farnesyltransferase
MIPPERPRSHDLLRDFLALTKPGLALMTVLTALVGFYLGASGPMEGLLLFHTLVGTGLAAGGTLALNQFIERDRDALMTRTQKRPLPAGRLKPGPALWFGGTLTAGGLLYLALLVNLLSSGVTGLITVTYLFFYTPLKHRTTLSTVVGAIPGALPPVTGWTAARGEIGLEALVLFAIMFLWQLPHALALAWLFRDDYARAGFQLLPMLDPDGSITSFQIFINCLALTAVSLLPTIIGMTGILYFFVALIAGLVFLGFAVRLTMTRSLSAARSLFFVSLLYLLVEFVTMAIDKA